MRTEKENIPIEKNAESLGVQVSDSAQAFLKKLLDNYEVTSTACRLFVEKAGTPNAETFLAYHPPDQFNDKDLILKLDGICLHLNADSAPYLQDTVIDFSIKSEQLTIASPYAKISQERSGASLLSKSSSTSQFSNLQGKTISLLFDCSAHAVPSGATVFLEKGTEVKVTQALGASFTLYVNGNLVRLDKRDATVLGLTEEEISDDLSYEGELTQEIVLNALKQCFDPEIPVNIVDLGLIYKCEIFKVLEDQGAIQYDIDILMTLTAVGCGMGDIIAMDAKSAVEALPNVRLVNVNMTFDPPWSKEMMSDVAKLHLGFF